MNTQIVKKGSHEEERLISLQQRMKEWRSQSAVKRRLPEAFWVEATELAKVLGVSRVSLVLKLRYQYLKKRVGIQAPAKITVSEIPLFQEVQWTAKPGECLEVGAVELTLPSGVRMKARASHLSAADLIPLIQQFLS